MSTSVFLASLQGQAGDCGKNTVRISSPITDAAVSLRNSMQHDGDIISRQFTFGRPVWRVGVAISYRFAGVISC